MSMSNRQDICAWILELIEKNPTRNALFWRGRVALELGTTEMKAEEYLKLLEATKKIKLDRYRIVTIRV